MEVTLTDRKGTAGRSTFRKTGKGNGLEPRRPCPLESSSEEAKAEVRRMLELSKTEKNFSEDQINPMLGGLLRANGGAFSGNEPTVIIGTPLKESSTLPRNQPSARPRTARGSATTLPAIYIRFLSKVVPTPGGSDAFS